MLSKDSTDLKISSLRCSSPQKAHCCQPANIIPDVYGTEHSGDGSTETSQKTIEPPNQQKSSVTQPARDTCTLCHLPDLIKLGLELLTLA